MDTGATTNIYSSLIDDDQEFRLLSLEADETDAPIQCHVHKYPLRSENRPKFEALSYVWGTPEFCKTITLNGQPYSITANLFLALRRLRRPSGGEPRILWVDALCINQSNLQERSTQVLLMRDIYTQAEADIAFLDVEQGSRSTQYNHVTDFTEGLKLLRRIQGHDVALLREMRTEWETRQPEDDFHLISRKYQAVESESTTGSTQDKPEPLLLSRDQMSELTQVFWSTCFYRMWIVQELVCAPRVILVSGEEELDWSVLSDLFGDRPYNDAFHAAWGHGDTIQPIFKSTFQKALLIEHQRKATRMQDVSPSGSGLLDVLNRFIDLNATDPRDRIYGLLGLLPKSHSIVPDYTKPIHKVFEDVTVAAINTMANLDVFCQSTFRVGLFTELPRSTAPKPRARARFDYSYWRERRRKPENTQASWVPEYFERRSNDILFAQRGIFSAGKASFETPCLVRDGKLQVQAILIDKIQPDEVDFMDIVHSLIHKNKDFLSTPYPHAPSTETTHNLNESRLRAFARTEVRDCTDPPRMRRMNTVDIDTVEQELLDRYAAYSRHGEDEPPWRASDDVHITASGLFALYEQGPQPGDVIAVIDGGKVPVVLRAAAESKYGDAEEAQYHFVCVAYLHGYMDGEAMREMEAGRLKKERAWLV